MSEIVGRLYLHSETGTEGGWWSIQDEKFIFPPDAEPSVKNCAVCHRHWGDPINEPEPKPLFTYYRPDRQENGKNYSGGYFSSEVPIEDGQTAFVDEEPGSFNDLWTKRSNDNSLRCYKDGHKWEWVEPTETWSYEGLNYIESGDILEILGESGETLYSIDVDLVMQEDQYAENAMGAKGMIIHSYPSEESFDFDKWVDLFFAGTRARLVRNG